MVDVQHLGIQENQQLVELHVQERFFVLVEQAETEGKQSLDTTSQDIVVYSENDIEWESGQT